MPVATAVPADIHHSRRSAHTENTGAAFDVRRNKIRIRDAHVVDRAIPIPLIRRESDGRGICGQIGRGVRAHDGHRPGLNRASHIKLLARNDLGDTRRTARYRLGFEGCRGHASGLVRRRAIGTGGRRVDVTADRRDTGSRRFSSDGAGRRNGRGVDIVSRRRNAFGRVCNSQRAIVQ